MSEKRWTWDLYPLSRDPWPPRRYDEPAGSIITLLGVGVPTRWRYVPTDAELAFLRRRFPGFDPSNPPWVEIEAALATQGCLVGQDTKALTILALLMQTKVKRYKPPLCKCGGQPTSSGPKTLKGGVIRRYLKCPECDREWTVDEP